MRGLDGPLQPIACDMGVYLSRRDVGVAEQRLHAPKIGAAFDQMRRERMAQDMRRQSRAGSSPAFTASAFSS